MSKKEKPETKKAKCWNCGKEFKSKRVNSYSWTTYCSQQCVRDNFMGQRRAKP